MNGPIRLAADGLGRARRARRAGRAAGTGRARRRRGARRRRVHPARHAGRARGAARRRGDRGLDPAAAAAAARRSRPARSTGSRPPLAPRRSRRWGGGSWSRSRVPVLAVAAAASILGLPLGLSLLLAFGLIALVGLALATFAVGRLIVRRTARSCRGAVRRLGRRRPRSGWCRSSTSSVVGARVDVRPRRRRRRDLACPRGGTVTRVATGPATRARRDASRSAPAHAPSPSRRREPAEPGACRAPTRPSDD